MASPGASWRSSGNEDMEADSKPGDAERVAEEVVNRECSNCGFVVDVYCPGSKWTSADAPEALSFAPTKDRFRECYHRDYNDILVVFENP